VRAHLEEDAAKTIHVGPSKRFPARVFSAILKRRESSRRRRGARPFDGNGFAVFLRLPRRSDCH